MLFCEPGIRMAAAVATRLGVIHSLWGLHSMHSGRVTLAPCVLQETARGLGIWRFRSHDFPKGIPNRHTG
jgi:hypothetical protein